MISPDPQSPNHELVTCSACGLSRRRLRHAEPDAAGVAQASTDEAEPTPQANESLSATGVDSVQINTMTEMSQSTEENTLKGEQ